jgi:hypothetical protein
MAAQMTAQCYFFPEVENKAFGSSTKRFINTLHSKTGTVRYVSVYQSAKGRLDGRCGGATIRLSVL